MFEIAVNDMTCGHYAPVIFVAAIAEAGCTPVVAPQGG